MDRIGEKIKELRKSRGYTLRKLGERMNIAYTHISNIENGKKRPNLEFITNLSELFDVPSSYFFDDEDLTNEEKDLMKDLSLDNDDILKKYVFSENDKQIDDELAKKVLGLLRNADEKKLKTALAILEGLEQE